MTSARDHRGPSVGARRRAVLLGLVLVTAGLTAVMAAGLGAPQQPELFPSGGACQFAMCGELEDPPRWRAMWMLFAVGLTVSLAGLLTALVALPPGLPRSSVLRCLAAVAIVCLTAPAPLGLAFVGGFLGSMQFGYALPLLWVAALCGCVHGLVFGRAVTRWSVLVVLVPTSVPYAVVVALTAP